MADDINGLSDEEVKLLQLHSRLEDITAFLYCEEMEVLVEVAEGIAEGQKKIGPFDLDNDHRDFEREADEEQRDELVYRASQVVRERRRRNKRG